MVEPNNKRELEVMDRDEFVIVQVQGSYLLEYGHNTYEEIMNMTANEIGQRFKGITGERRNDDERNI